MRQVEGKLRNEWPSHLWVARHGLSVLNDRYQLTGQDRQVFEMQAVLMPSGVSWDLTQVGIDQAIATKATLSRIPEYQPTLVYVSPYVRALHTAALLIDGNQRARVKSQLAERFRGTHNLEHEGNELWARDMECKNADPFHWKPPNGESIAQVVLRARDVLGSLFRTTSNNVLMVTHGEFMWALYVAICGIDPYNYNLLDRSDDPAWHIGNCHIMHFESVNGINFTHFEMFSGCDPEAPRIPRSEIQRVDYSSEELMKLVAEHGVRF